MDTIAYDLQDKAKMTEWEVKLCAYVVLKNKN